MFSDDAPALSPTMTFGVSGVASGIKNELYRLYFVE